MTIKMLEEILGRVKLYEPIFAEDFEKEQEWIHLQSDLIHILNKILISQLEPVRPQYRSYHQGMKTNQSEKTNE